MVANGHVGFWVAGLMIFCIIELHLSLLLTCFEETVAEAKHPVDICPHSWLNYARQIIKLGITSLKIWWKKT